MGIDPAARVLTGRAFLLIRAEAYDVNSRGQEEATLRRRHALEFSTTRRLPAGIRTCMGKSARRLSISQDEDGELIVRPRTPLLDVSPYDTICLITVSRHDTNAHEVR